MDFLAPWPATMMHASRGGVESLFVNMRSFRSFLAMAAFTLGSAALAFGCAAQTDDWRILDPNPSSSPIAGSTPIVAFSPGPKVAPFLLPASEATRGRAIDCLTAAVYYEAATEPREGQEAVAQVVLNRLRHPAFPKSVCGVIYDGVGTASTCQFTFACDGSTSRRPVPRLWENAREVAQAALAGHVATRIGAATHYHADYVSPYWRTSLTQVGQIGHHIFYAMPGWNGTAAALTGQYSGDEPSVPQVQSAGLTTVATRPMKPGERSVEFTVWGLKMATISVKRGQISVKSAS